MPELHVALPLIVMLVLAIIFVTKGKGKVTQAPPVQSGTSTASAGEALTEAARASVGA